MREFAITLIAVAGAMAEIMGLMALILIRETETGLFTKRMKYIIAPIIFIHIIFSLVYFGRHREIQKECNTEYKQVNTILYEKIEK